ncbi:hypothetical protein C8J56DRAFT_322315 [Mycena floridula]|nr:hypothetical protein C8J56DRAFT_322315 [Mycena floridula]
MSIQAFLVSCFTVDAYPSRLNRRIIGTKTHLSERQVEVWFQNRRRRLKKTNQFYSERKGRDSDRELEALVKNFPDPWKTDGAAYNCDGSTGNVVETPDLAGYVSLNAPRYSAQSKPSILDSPTSPCPPKISESTNPFSFSNPPPVWVFSTPHWDRQPGGSDLNSTRPEIKDDRNLDELSRKFQRIETWDSSKSSKSEAGGAAVAAYEVRPLGKVTIDSSAGLPGLVISAHRSEEEVEEHVQTKSMVIPKDSPAISASKSLLSAASCETTASSIGSTRLKSFVSQSSESGSLDELVASSLSRRPSKRPAPPPSPIPTYIEPAYEWFISNLHNPYPCRATRGRLASASGFPRAQVDSWFTAARRWSGWNDLFHTRFTTRKSMLEAALRYKSTSSDPFLNPDSNEKFLDSALHLEFTAIEIRAKEMYAIEASLLKGTLDEAVELASEDRKISPEPHKRRRDISERDDLPSKRQRSESIPRRCPSDPVSLFPRIEQSVSDPLPT